MRFGKTALQIQRLGAGRQNAVDRDISAIVEEEERIAVRDAGARIADRLEELVDRLPASRGGSAS